MAEYDTAILRMGTAAETLSFEWTQYDGDDCFEQFCIQHIVDGKLKDEFQFGGCAIRLVRKFELLLKGEINRVESGFRIPQVVYLDIDRESDLLKIHVYSAKLSLDTRIAVKNEVVEFEKLYLDFHQQNK